jgi:glycosyltransferase involved in cell wall biosynthesis
VTLVTCIVPVFNGARYLRETLDSILAQTHRSIEVIVVDDGSTDESAALASTHPGVTVLSQPNGGHASARNRGIESARGEFIAFDDADDLWEPEKIERQLDRFAARPELGVVFTHLQNFWSPEVPEEARVSGESMEPVPGYTSVTMLARREVFATVGPLDVSLKHGNDRDYFLRASDKGIVMEMMPHVMVRRRLHASNRSAEHAASSRSEYLRILKASLDRRREGGRDVAGYGFGSTGDRGKT